MNIPGAYEGYFCALFVAKHYVRDLRQSRRASCDEKQTPTLLAATTHTSNGPGLRRVATFASPDLRGQRESPSPPTSQLVADGSGGGRLKIAARTKSSVGDDAAADDSSDAESLAASTPRTALTPSVADGRADRSPATTTNFQTRASKTAPVMLTNRQKYYANVKFDDLEEKVKLALENYRKVLNVACVHKLDGYSDVL